MKINVKTRLKIQLAQLIAQQRLGKWRLAVRVNGEYTVGILEKVATYQIKGRGDSWVSAFEDA